MDGLSGAEIQVHKAYEAWIDSLKAQLAAKDAVIDAAFAAVQAWRSRPGHEPFLLPAMEALALALAIQAQDAPTKEGR